jgi:F0F1-type ATP synthase assembly protein I
MFYLVQTLVPIFVCVVLPVAVIFINYRASMNRENKRAEVLIKAIEVNNGIDAEKLAEAFSKPKKTAREVLSLRLLRGCVSTLVGLAFGIYGIYMDCAHPDAWLQMVAYLICGALLAIGIGYLIVYFVTRKQVLGNADENQE